MRCMRRRRQHVIPTGPVRIGSTSVLPLSSVRDLGVYIDADVTVKTHVINTIKACSFSSLRQLRNVHFTLDYSSCYFINNSVDALRRMSAID